MEDHELAEVLKNAVHVGKFTQSKADDLSKLAVDKETMKTVTGFIAASQIKPEKLKGVYSPAVIDMAGKSYDELEKQAGGIRPLAKVAPEIYKAKFFEKHGRMPQVLPDL